MTNPYAIAFAAAAAAAFLGADYVDQAGKAGVTPGSFPLDRYLDTFASRAAPAPEGAAARSESVATAPAPVPETRAPVPRTAGGDTGLQQGGAAGPAPGAGVRRLQLSGGRACLDGAAGRLCGK